MTKRGRPPIGSTRRIKRSISLTPEDEAELIKINPSISLAIRELIATVKDHKCEYTSKPTCNLYPPEPIEQLTEPDLEEIVNAASSQQTLDTYIEQLKQERQHNG